MKRSEEARQTAIEALEAATSPDFEGAENLDTRLALDRYYLAANALAGALHEAGR
jgi:hypothetical protein